MRVSEYGDKFVRIDFSFDRGERGMETFTGERGAHLNVSGSQKSASKKANRAGAMDYSPCTRQTPSCTCASANFRGIILGGDDGEEDGDEVEEGGHVACNTVVMSG
jgi:hypothetical protein